MSLQRTDRISLRDLARYGSADVLSMLEAAGAVAVVVGTHDGEREICWFPVPDGGLRQIVLQCLFECFGMRATTVGSPSTTSRHFSLWFVAATPPTLPSPCGVVVSFLRFPEQAVRAEHKNWLAVAGVAGAADEADEADMLYAVELHLQGEQEEADRQFALSLADN